jgi:hypothetical protein
MTGFVSSRTSGPMLRWWWPNAAVEADVLVGQLEAAAAAGYGGVEIASVLGVGTPPFAGFDPASMGVHYEVDPAQYGYGGPRWSAAVEAVLEAAARLDLRVDLTMGAHWPPAVPGLDVDGPGTVKELVYGYEVLSEGRPFTGSVPTPTPRLYDDRSSTSGVVTSVTRTATPTLVATGAVRCGGDLSTAPLVDLASHVDLTANVRDGKLSWTPPDDGTWLLVGYWYRGTAARNDLPFGTLSALYSDPEARAVDYFDHAGVDAFTSYFEGILSPRTKELLRQVRASIFEDSIEITVGAAQLWTPRLLEEFERRRGYTLLPYLSVLAADAPEGFGMQPRPAFTFAGADADRRERVLRDVDQTYNDLYVDEHLIPLRTWVNELGLTFRAQPYGLPIDLAEAASQLDVAEAENFACATSDDWRLVASGVALAGKAIVSDELIPGITPEHRPPPYTSTQRGIVQEVNAQYALGANQIVFHGLPYPHWPPSADSRVTDAAWGWPGFHPFGALFSEAFGPREPGWSMRGDVNVYLARTQQILQAGTLRLDLAVYNESLGHIAGAFDPGVLEGRGYTFGYVTPGLLRHPDAGVGGRTLAPRGPAFKALVIDDQQTMPLAAARAIDGFAADDLPVLVVGEAPSRIPGFAATPEAAEERDQELREVVETLLRRPSVRRVKSAADLPDALRSLGIEAAATAGACRTVRRTDGDTEYYFVHNDSDAEVSTTAALTGTGVPYGLDAWSGRAEPLGRFQTSGPRVEVPVSLAPGEAALIAIGPPEDEAVHATGTTTGANVVDGGASSPRLPAAVELASWDLVVDDWRPPAADQPASSFDHVEWSFSGVVLRSWNEIPELADVSGIGRYTSTVELPPDWAGVESAYLRLGTVHGEFRVRVNDQPVGVVNPLTASVDVGPLLRPGANRVEVLVATNLINRVRATRQIFAHVPPQPYGLLGPVTLTPSAWGPGLTTPGARRTGS